MGLSAHRNWDACCIEIGFSRASTSQHLKLVSGQRGRMNGIILGSRMQLRVSLVEVAATLLLCQATLFQHLGGLRSRLSMQLHRLESLHGRLALPFLRGEVILRQRSVFIIRLGLQRIGIVVPANQLRRANALRMRIIFGRLLLTDFEFTDRILTMSQIGDRFPGGANVAFPFDNINRSVSECLPV